MHFVPEQAEGLALLFGGETGDEIDKFARCRWRAGPGGAGAERAGGLFAGRVLERVPFGDHCGFLLEPIEGETHRSPEGRSRSAGRSGSSRGTGPGRWVISAHSPPPGR